MEIGDWTSLRIPEGKIDERFRARFKLSVKLPAISGIELLSPDDKSTRQTSDKAFHFQNGERRKDARGFDIGRANDVIYCGRLGRNEIQNHLFLVG